MTNTIFITGIHGTGKTTLGNKVSEQLSYSFDSASNIIKRMTEINWDSEKKVDNIDKNQNTLIDGIKHFYSNNETILLDGHFTLLDKKKQITKLPTQTFENLNIKLIIVCIANPQTILMRLAKRDMNNNIALDTIAEFQEAEINHAKFIAKYLGIPIIFFETEKEQPINFIINQINGGIKL
ncbi:MULTISPECIES: ATP-binding protein [Niallia]|uniref:AAA family ATPase n=1 Tax=Niallia circulans TaxID=1397 RepID=A0A941GG83_NIACI|nr:MULTISPECIES: ATP-binding protein [Niallia]MCB5235545.1 AAA family ATPase [Niallia circulans]MED3795745.1 ATP-binding protein [Niallia alba]